MLSFHRHRIWRGPIDMENMKRKSRSIVEALVAGDSCGQIPTRDGTLMDHDLLHELSEAPTSFWQKASARSIRLHSFATLVRTPLSHCMD